MQSTHYMMALGKREMTLIAVGTINKGLPIWHCKADLTLFCHIFGTLSCLVPF